MLVVKYSVILLLRIVDLSWFVFTANIDNFFTANMIIPIFINQDHGNSCVVLFVVICRLYILYAHHTKQLLQRTK